MGKIGEFGGLLGSIVGATVQGIGNRKNRKSQEKINRQNLEYQSAVNQQNYEISNYQYERSRADAVRDRDYANKYNSPAAQMQRLKEAGLNPNLAYGDMSSGQSAIIRGADSPTPNMQAPNLLAPRSDLSFMSTAADAILNYFDIQAKKASTAQINQQTKNLVTTELGLQLDNINKQIEIEKNGFNLKLLYDTRDLIIEQMKANVKNTQANIEKTEADTQSTLTGTQINLNRDAREQLLSAQNIKQAAATLVQTYAQTAKTNEEKKNLTIMREGLKNTNELQKLDLILKQKGLTYSDPAAVRIITQYLREHKLDLNYRVPDNESQRRHDSIMNRR